MPYYRCVVPEGSVSYEQRRRVAKAFTDIHCGSTNAPRSFVHVVFDESPDSRFTQPYFVDGGNRAGRPEELKAQLLSDLVGAFQEITGAPSDLVGGRITEGPAKWTMEGGMVLPEPGEETAEWYEHDTRIQTAAAGG